MATVNIVECERDDELYHRYRGQTEPQGAYVALDCRTGRLWASYRGEIGNGVPVEVWHGHVCRWSIPPLKAAPANRLLAEIAPLAQVVCDGYESRWNGSNHVARFDCGEHTDTCECREYDEPHPGSAADALERIARLCEAEDDAADCVQAWDAADWYAGLGRLAAQCAHVGITAATTDAELKTIEAREREAAEDDGVIVEGLVRHLERLREHARESAAEECTTEGA